MNAPAIAAPANSHNHAFDLDLVSDPNPAIVRQV
jgi:hypothetical protein